MPERKVQGIKKYGKKKGDREGVSQGDYGLYASLIEQTHDAIYLLYEGRFEYINKKFSELFRITPEEAKSPEFHFFNLVAPESRKLIQERIERFFRGESINSTYEFTAIRKDGQKIEVEASVSHVPYKKGMAAQGILRDITERKRSHIRLSRINDCFLNFVSEPIENIQKLTCLFGELMEATCALYNRLERGILVSAGHWQTPPDFKMMDKPDGHICYDVINKGGDNPIIIRNLEETLYNTTDPNVMRYGLRTYIGQAVKSGTEYVGSLCAVFQEDYVPTPEDINIMGIVAAALGVEEVRLGSALELKNREHLLATKSRNLEELNTALKVLVKSREEDRLELEEKILLNVKKLVLPYIVKLKNTGLSATQKTLTEILENNVKNISSSFSRNLSLKYLHFTPQEIQVANLIKEGMTSKSIAELLHVSRRTIDFHRENIRTKLGMRNKKANLRTYLLSMS